MRASFFLRNVIPVVLTGLALLTFSSTALAHDGEDLEITVQCTSLDRTVLGISIKQFEQETIMVGGRDYLAVNMEGEGRVMKEGSGYPHLPALYRSIMIPDAAKMEVNVLDQAFTDYTDVDLISSKGDLLRIVDPATVPYTFGDDYNRDAWFPSDIATLREPYILHDVRGVVVEVFPFQYNPVQKVLRVYTELEVEVKAAGAGAVNILDRQRMPKRPDRSFHAIYMSHFINSSGSRTDPPSEDGDMLIISHGPFMAAMQPLIDWKNSIGITTTIVDVATIGNNSTSIKNHISNVYGSSNLSFVLLVGDYTEVRSGTYGSGLSDAYYSLMGGDNYPDLFVGRFSATTVGHVDTQVERSIVYEQQGHDLSMGGWNTWGMGVASDQGAGAGHYGEADYVHMNLIRDELLTYGFLKVDQIYDNNGGNKTKVSAGLNEGRRVVNYCGHGSSTSWGSTGFSNTDVNNLMNVDTLPFIHSVACVNGAFDSGTCFAEAWLRATYNGEPSGAVATYMSTVNQSWAPPMYAQGNHAKSSKYGSAERFWMETNWSLGGCWYGGGCCMMDLAGSTGVSEFRNWVIFGDPSLRLSSMPAMTMKLTDGVPEGYQPPGLENVITLQIISGTENYVPGSGTLHYRFDPNDPFTTITVTPLGGDLFEATLPNTRPGDEPEFYFSAQGDGGTTLYKPAGAPASCYSFEVCFLNLLYSDTFEGDKGWTINSVNLTDGEWERGKPAGDGSRGDPTQDGDGSGKCYLTDNIAGNSDVDGGPTIMTSPTLDLSSGDAEISYYRWHYNDDNDDWFTVEISNDNGVTWNVVEKVQHTDGWIHHGFNVSDITAPTAQMKMRFSAIDNPNNSVTEAGVDGFTIQRLIWDASLWADDYAISVAVGDTVTLSMDAGAGNGNRPYLILGSITGTEPGFPLPGGLNVPLNWDAFTNLVLTALGSPVFQNFMGTLDGTGGASAVFNTLGPVDPAMVGQTLNLAYILNPPPGWDFVSNAIPITFDP